MAYILCVWRARNTISRFSQQYCCNVIVMRLLLLRVWSTDTRKYTKRTYFSSLSLSLSLFWTNSQEEKNGITKHLLDSPKVVSTFYRNSITHTRTFYPSLSLTHSRVPSFIFVVASDGECELTRSQIAECMRYYTLVNLIPIPISLFLFHFIHLFILQSLCSCSRWLDRSVSVFMCAKTNDENIIKMLNANMNCVFVFSNKISLFFRSTGRLHSHSRWTHVGISRCAFTDFSPQHSNMKSIFFQQLYCKRMNKQTHSLKHFYYIFIIGHTHTHFHTDTNTSSLFVVQTINNLEKVVLLVKQKLIQRKWLEKLDKLPDTHTHTQKDSHCGGKCCKK